MLDTLCEYRTTNFLAMTICVLAESSLATLVPFHNMHTPDCSRPRLVSIATSYMVPQQNDYFHLILFQLSTTLRAKLLSNLGLNALFLRIWKISIEWGCGCGVVVVWFVVLSDYNTSPSLDFDFDFD